jgi:hypothetical protein
MDMYIVDRLKSTALDQAASKDKLACPQITHILEPPYYTGHFPGCPGLRINWIVLRIPLSILYQGSKYQEWKKNT